MKSQVFAVFALLAGLLPGAALAGARDDVVQGIVRCGGLADDRQWLDCVYGAAQPMRAQLGLSPAPVAQQRLVPGQGYGTLPGYGGTPPPAPGIAAARPAPQPQSEKRGFFAHLMGEKDVPDVVSRMTSYSFNRQGLFTVTLANGQSWIQVDSESNPAHWVRPAERYIVTISPGAFSTYNLTVASEPGAFKVKLLR